MVKEDKMFIVDRIENNTVLIETPNGFIKADKSKIIGQFKEGSVLLKCGENYKVDNNATIVRRKTMAEKQNRLFSDKY